MPAIVLNSDANINGKTLLAAENADTITGLKTFSRGAASPFAVALGALLVANLDADKLDGLDGSAYYVKATDGALQTYVPTWANITVNNGINVGGYHVVGKKVTWTATLQWGTTTAWTPASITGPTLPVAATSQHIPAFMAQGYLYDFDLNQYRPLLAVQNTTTAIVLATNASPMAGIFNTAPVTMAVNDVIAVGGCYWIP